MKRIPIEELLNKKFGRLTIISEAEPRTQPNGESVRLVKCLCDCGKTIEIRLGHLKNGNTQSCGCLQQEIVTKHSKINHQLYKIYFGIKQRCTNPNRKEYKNYGARGVKICEEWLTDFMNFYNWAMASGYEKGLEIDRIDNDSNYEPNNCRWVTHKVNNQNKRTTKLTPEEAQDIRNAYLLGCFTQKEIAGAYNISPTTVCYVVNNIIWI